MIKRRNMNRLKKALTLSLGLLILATAAALITGANLKASTPPPPIVAATVTSVPVSVTNTPLPVTGSVNIGTPTVNVGSLPAVQLSGTPAVTFTNTASTPIYVDTDRPARDSFDATCATSNYDETSGQASCTLFTIPAGAQVVIETVGCTAEVAAGQGPAQADLVVPNIPYGASPASGASEYLFNLAMTKQTNSSSGVDIWGITNQVHIYGGAPTGGGVDIGVFLRASLPNLSPPQGMFCSMSGYVVQ
jgi:hypothetical protein